MVLNYTEDINMDIDTNSNLIEFFLFKLLDLFFILMSILICLVKFGIALFLL